VDISNNGINETKINSTTHFFRDVETMVIYAKLYIPQSDLDLIYKTEVFSTVYNAKKMLDGIESNIVMKVFMERFRESVNFPLSFPVKKVRTH
jgi:hypothetical protein